MNLKNVLKVYGLLRQFSDDETALLKTLQAMSESERELLVESLAPEKPVKKPVKTRNLEHCGICDYTRRAVQHKDPNASGYHEFQSSKPKSARASSLQQQIQGAAKPSLCTYEINGKVCHGTENDGIHDKLMGYAAYHPFESSSSARSAGKGSSSKNGSQDMSAASSEAEKESVSSVTGD